MTMRHSCALFIAVCLTSAAAVVHATPEAACKAMISPEAGMRLVSAEYRPATLDVAGDTERKSSGPLPPYCRVEGMLEERQGVDGHRYAIGFALALPDEWNGRFLFQGGGGLNGVVREPVGGYASGERSALARGFAVVSTDSGHQAEVRFDTTFLRDQQAVLNFTEQAVVKVTHAARQLTQAYYGKTPSRSYFVGCSTGGREAMIASQRYPNLFDGIIAAAPVMRANLSEIGDMWSAAQLSKVAPRAGQPPFSTAEKRLIVKSVLAQCDALDGLADGMVMNPDACAYDPAVLVCASGQKDGCLSDAQITALRAAFAGPVDVAGKQVYPGFFFDTAIGADGPDVIPGLLQGVPGPLGGNVADFDLAAAVAKAESFPLALGNATWTNLSTFASSGKIIYLHGVSDPWFSAKDTLNYYRDMAAENGGLKSVREWARFFFVPGMAHCHGGEAALDQFDMLGSLVEWVESGRAPDAVVATGAAFPGRERPLCAWPEHAHFRGKGDSERADSFECK